MALLDSLSIALKEWSVVTTALSTGRQILLLRKGGISEDSGKFVLEHPQFLLFPTYLHQHPDMVKAPERPAASEAYAAEPDRLTLTTAAEVTDIVQLKDRAQMDALDAEHIWMPPLIDMRFNYRPKNPLYLMLVRAYRLPSPVTIDNTPAYAGCKSWVPLDSPISTTGVTPVLPDAHYDARRARILESLVK